MHYNKNDEIVKDGSLILADMGGNVCGYVSDITSTYPANGKFTDK